MKIHVYAVCYNEEKMLPYFIRHYERFAERLFIADGGSSDGSLEILNSHPKVILAREIHGDGLYEEEVLMRFRNFSYAFSRGRADWVMVVDVDEFVYHPRLLSVLEACKRDGVTLPCVRGFEMLCPQFPQTDGQIYDEVKRGVPNQFYDKSAVFDPSLEINFDPGCHGATPCGNVQKCATDLFLLHYRFLGEDHFVRKYQTRIGRLSASSARLGQGTVVIAPNGQLHSISQDEADLSSIYRRIVSGLEPVKVID